MERSIIFLLHSDCQFLKISFYSRALIQAVSGHFHENWAILQPGYEAVPQLCITPCVANHHVIHPEIHHCPWCLYWVYQQKTKTVEMLQPLAACQGQLTYQGKFVTTFSSTLTLTRHFADTFNMTMRSIFGQAHRRKAWLFAFVVRFSCSAVLRSCTRLVFW